MALAAVARAGPAGGVGVRSALAQPLAFAFQAWYGAGARYAFMAAAIFFLGSVVVMGRLYRAGLRAEHTQPTDLTPEPPSLPARAFGWGRW